MKFHGQQNARMFFVQFMAAQLFNGNSLDDIKQYFCFENQNFDEKKFSLLYDTYQEKKTFITNIINEFLPLDLIAKSIIIMGITDLMTGVDKPLVISECLKISDLFYNNTKLINIVMEDVYKKINQ